MANFDLFKIKKIKVKELDTAIKSSSDNGTVKTRAPYTKIRKSFTVTPITYSTDAEFAEFKALWDAVRTVTPFVWNHPTELNDLLLPKQYTVRFKDAPEWEQDAALGNYFQVSEFILEEV